MGEETKIQWADHTFNPWIGCAKVSPGCEHCYAEALMDTRWGKARWGQAGTRVRTSDANWRLPLKWNRAAEKAGERRRVFCASLCDVFEENKKVARWRYQLADLIFWTEHLAWLILTKRPENIKKLWRLEYGANEQYLPRNVWLGVSVENQEQADKRIPLLLQCPAAVRFVSVEPLLGPVDLDNVTFSKWTRGSVLEGGGITTEPRCMGQTIPNCSVPVVDWVIVGGESGPNARPCSIEWIRSIRDQCKAAGVPCFIKQIGREAYDLAGDHLMANGEPPVGTYLDLHDSKGGDPTEWPEDLRVREFPGGKR